MPACLQSVSQLPSIRLSFASPADSNGGWGNYYGDNYPYYGGYDSGSYGGGYNGYSGEPDIEHSIVIFPLPSALLVQCSLDRAPSASLITRLPEGEQDLPKAARPIHMGTSAFFPMLTVCMQGATAAADTMTAITRATTKATHQATTATAAAALTLAATMVRDSSLTP